ncbi:glycosyltransferase family 1 protein [Paraburkholderia sp. MPAMCS5]|uniref:glycosyltransferase family 4 protein n=1 Tax=Paraburkholderia sp. MPAMCS5 TaxID=3112563 RepID=UPI002E182A00|nr:glycosyltransferase family 1 protein [Paraburkholderia sp. MPAMCS5]
MSVVWLDVTTIMGWLRPAVGIVRTEAECANYALALQKKGVQVKFCQFSNDSGYDEVAAERVAETLMRITGHAGDSRNAPPQQPRRESVPLRRKLKKTVLALAYRLPHRWREHVFAFMRTRKPAVVAGWIALAQLRGASRAFMRPVTSLLTATADRVQFNKDTPFRPGDKYISLGLDWDHKDLKYLYHLKKTVGLRVLLFCYDVIPVKLPHLCVGDVAARFALYFTNVAWCADKILCISDCSRNDLTELLTELGAPIPALDTVRLGCHLPEIDPNAEPSPAVAKMLERRYLLFVSTIERRKNHETLYRAYTRLVDKGVENLPLLVFVGMHGWGVGDLFADLRLDPRTKDYIQVLNNVSDSELSRLYRSALFTLFPSVYEGWGLPVAESLAAGKFCLASNAASIPEVGGELIEYLDPWDVSVWTERLKWYIEHPSEVERKEAAIREHYVTTKWSDAAQSVFAAAEIDCDVSVG